MCWCVQDSSALVSCLEDGYGEDMALPDMVSLADKVLNKCSAFSGHKTPVDAALVGVKGTRLWERVAWHRLSTEILATGTADQAVSAKQEEG